MRKAMLLATALAAIAIVPASASAQGYGLTQSHVTSSFGLKVVVRDAPKVVQHHYPVRHLRPQPWPRYFSHHGPSWSHHAPSWRSGHHAPSWRWGHHAPSWRWHNPWRADHFHRHQRGRPGWSPGPGRAFSNDRDWRVRAPGHGWGPGAPHRGPYGR
jgi:hypothetical protein